MISHFLEETVRLYKEKIIVGIDAKNGFVATRGWLDVSEISYIDLAKQMEKIGVQTIVFTDISKDGTLAGPNVEQLELLQKERCYSSYCFWRNCIYTRCEKS